MEYCFLARYGPSGTLDCFLSVIISRQLRPFSGVYHLFSQVHLKGPYLKYVS